MYANASSSTKRRRSSALRRRYGPNTGWPCRSIAGERIKRVAQAKVSESTPSHAERKGNAFCSLAASYNSAREDRMPCSNTFVLSGDSTAEFSSKEYSPYVI